MKNKSGTNIVEISRDTMPWSRAAPVEIIAATDLAPVNGDDGFVEIIWPEGNNGSVFYKTDDKGNVDFRERLDMEIVRKGDKVAVLVPPTPGCDGVSEMGELITAVPGAPAQIIAGRNVGLDESEENAFALKDGKLIVSGNTVLVDEFMRIDGNVDYTTGNITFDGSVAVEGDLLPGFYISASGDVEIFGAVDGGSISSDSSIVIKGPVLGGGKSRIKAKRDITIKSADQAVIQAGGFLTVDHFLRNCNVKVNEDLIIIHKKKGHILSGKTVVGGNIETFDLGSLSYAPTIVELGAKPETLDQYNECITEIRQLEVQIEKIAPNLKNLYSQKREGVLCPEKHMLFSNMLHAYKTLQKKQLQFEGMIENIEGRLKILKAGNLTVHGTVYSGVNIRIGILSCSIEEEMERVVFSEKDEEIDINHF